MYIYLATHLIIYVSIYLTIELATDFSLYLDTNLQSPACIWIEDWRFHRNSFLKSSVLRGGLTIRRKNLVESSFWRGKGFHLSTHSISFRPSTHSIHPIHQPILSIHPSILSVHLHIYLPSYLFTYLSTYLPIYLAIYLSIHPSNYTFIQRCNPWVACGLKIQERTIFSPKKGTEGTDNKKHWEASKPTIKQNCTGFDTY